jgi:DNA-binding transcriptional LysR family regulator
MTGGFGCMSDILVLFKTFSRTVELGSFSAVARELNSSQPTISRQIATLEDHLGCLLFQRTTRALTLTDDGHTFYDHARRTLEAAVEAEGSVGRRKGKPSGRLRLATSVVFGRLHLISRLQRFRSRYPAVDIELIMTDGTSDLVSEGIDMAVRIGEQRESNLIARRIGTSRMVVVASPAYLQAAGTPHTLEELKQHNCIIYSGRANSTEMAFQVEGQAVNITVQGWLTVTSPAGIREAVLQSLGIAYIPVWHFVDNELATGKLQLLLEQFETRPLPIHVVYPSRRYLAPKVRAMVDFLAKEFEIDPYLTSYGES